MLQNAAIFSDPRLFELIVEASPSGMLIADSEGTIILVNEKIVEWFGYAAEELVGQPVEVLIPVAQSSAHVTLRKRYSESPCARPMALGQDLYARRKDHSDFPVDISLHPIESKAGKLVLANIVNATQRRQAERDREARETMERLAMLGQLAGGVAHEIRTPLCVIGNDVYFLQTLADKLGPEGMECVSEIREAVAKANRIVSELLDFTREPDSAPEPVAVGPMIQAAISSASISPEIKFLCAEIPNDVCSDVDQDQIERILVNLLHNADQAQDGQGRIELDIRSVENDLIIDVIDWGPGIDNENRDKIFEPLFTTKPKGIGLGLALSKRYAERNKGSLTLQDGKSAGATFRLKIPICPSGEPR